MKSFKDKDGKSWIIEVNVRQVRKIRALLNIDLANMIQFDAANGKPNTELLDRLSNDPCLLVDVIYALCKDQADTLNITDEQFGENMNGDTVEAATVALLEEMIDFFPEAKRRVLRVILNQAEALTRQMQETAAAVLENPEFQETLKKQLMKSSTNVPE